MVVGDIHSDQQARASHLKVRLVKIQCHRSYSKHVKHDTKVFTKVFFMCGMSSTPKSWLWTTGNGFPHLIWVTRGELHYEPSFPPRLISVWLTSEQRWIWWSKWVQGRLHLWNRWCKRWSRVAEVAREHGWPPPKSLDSDENFKPEHMLFCRDLRFVGIYALFGDLWAKNVPFWVKNTITWYILHI